MTTLHTPGPWHIGTGNGLGCIFPDTGRMRLEEGGTALYPIASIHSGWNAVEDTANGQLIAASPTMLAALRCALADLEGILPEYDPEREHPAWETLEEVRAAIAKATGVQP
jgi:hypothetical protein